MKHYDDPVIGPNDLAPPQGQTNETPRTMPGLQPRDRPNYLVKTATTTALESARREDIENRIILAKA